MNNSRIRGQVFTGIVISKKNFGESDKLLEVFTKEVGKVRVLAKGARKVSSKIGGSTELFSHGNLTLAKGRNFYILTGIEAKNYSNIWNNLSKLSRFYMIAEFISRILPEEQKHSDIYDKTLLVFSAIDRGNNNFIDSEFLYKTLFELGFVGSSTECNICHSQDKETLNYFDSSLPGVICRKCSKNRPKKFEISKNFLKILIFIEQNEFQEYLKLSFEEREGICLVRAVGNYLDHIHQKEFKSREFIGKIKLLK